MPPLEQDNRQGFSSPETDDMRPSEPAPQHTASAVPPVADLAKPSIEAEAEGDSAIGGKLRRYGLMLSVPLLLALAGGYLWLTSGRSVSTDNAYVAQNKVSVSSEIGGVIVEVAVRENQQVKAGDLLFRIDPEPHRIAIAEANADIASAQANVTTLQLTADTMGADIETARRALTFAQTNLAREQALMARGFNTRARIDAAENAVNEARGRLADAQAAQARAMAQLATGSIAPGVNPGILSAEVRRDQAMLQLRRTEVRAPTSGVISQAERLHVGQMIVAGLPAVSIVANGQSWVEANFKETDLDRMRVGQRATIEFDAYPNLSLTGHVESIGAGTGSEFSVLPAQNATGNWVKVTQRVPVRIAIDQRSSRPLIAGLSAHVTVHFDNQNR
ncbi:HlyD family secretion protein [Sphingomonas lacunae]|nr:HlyD family secretion protein [Sphingomonas lacunae]